PDSTYLVAIDTLGSCYNKYLLNVREYIHIPAIPSIGDLYVNEILFNPLSGGVDFIELRNQKHKTFKPSVLFIGTLDEWGNYKSLVALNSDNMVISEKYILISADTLDVCKRYACGNSDQIKVQLKEMPSMPDDEGNIFVMNIRGEIIDSIFYKEYQHHPLLKEKDGVSLERVYSSSKQSNSLWMSASASSGYATPARRISQDIGIMTNQSEYELQFKTVSPNMDGYEDYLVLQLKCQKPGALCTLSVFNELGSRILKIMNNKLIGEEETLVWTATDEQGMALESGVYLLFIELHYPDGEIERERMAFAVVKN